MTSCMLAKSSLPHSPRMKTGGFFHPPVFPHNHRSHRVGALQMGDIETLDAARRLRQPERLLERVDNRLRAGLQDAEALLEGVARVLFNQLKEGVLRTPL